MTVETIDPQALDLLAAMLAGGRATHEMASDPLAETGLSQVFLAVHAEALGSMAELERVAEGCIAALHAATPVEPGAAPRYPGEGTLRIRERSLRDGVAVPEAVWRGFEALEAELDLRP